MDGKKSNVGAGLCSKINGDGELCTDFLRYGGSLSALWRTDAAAIMGHADAANGGGRLQQGSSLRSHLPQRIQIRITRIVCLRPRIPQPGRIRWRRQRGRKGAGRQGRANWKCTHVAKGGLYWNIGALIFPDWPQ